MKTRVLKTKPATPMIDEHDLFKTEDFQWLREIHSVLSPYWSARSGYAGAVPKTDPRVLKRVL
ncbi:MAG TPA: hypothetical protein VMU17_02300 [Elusimicrobiota bacterium]|nr:hypothetical protein [Elusimicrobiota bacterium]